MLQFSSRIQFVTRKEFAKQPLRQMHFINEFDGDNLYMTPAGFTRNIVMCNAGGLTGGPQAVMFHFQPWGATDENLTKLAYSIHLLRKRYPKIRALLVGGHEGDPQSLVVGERVARLFMQEGIPYTMFWGHPHDPRNNADSWRTDLAYYAASDTWVVRTYQTDWDRNDIKSPERLKQAYTRIYVDPGDEVFINGKRCQPDKLNKNPWAPPKKQGGFLKRLFE